MKKLILVICASLLAFSLACAYTPNKIVVPNVDGYKTLKGDFHIHTVFSDADVWPVTRVQEAIWEGLDVIAMTDHVDSRLAKNFNNGIFKENDRNRSFELAKKAAGKKLIVIHGGEISRGMPPGHWNCLFIQDCNKLSDETEKYDEDRLKPEGNHYEAALAGLTEAHAQGGWTMWNHPHWEKQAPNGAVWHKEHEKLYKAGFMQGIEVYNQFSGYSPEVHKWAIEKGITMFGNSDCHHPFFYMIDYPGNQHRPVTLVFAKEKSEAGVREALESHRTAVLAENMVYGTEETLKPLFDACIKVKGVSFSDKKLSFTLENKSSIPIRITKAPGNEKYYYMPNYEIRPFSSVNISVNANLVDNHSQKITVDTLDVNFFVETFQVGPNKPLHVVLSFEKK